MKAGGATNAARQQGTTYLNGLTGVSSKSARNQKDVGWKLRWRAKSISQLFKEGK
jgi:hypothetical protein